jgi:hypothetical protein
MIRGQVPKFRPLGPREFRLNQEIRSDDRGMGMDEDAPPVGDEQEEDDNRSSGNIKRRLWKATCRRLASNVRSDPRTFNVSYPC